jgi:3-deoxy-D-manno-octulosonic acid kinase
MTDAYSRHVGPYGGYLVASSYQQAFLEDWFDPEFWGSRAEKVTAGGRGAAWFIGFESGDLVLRHFCRGGLPGRLLRRDYLYTGTDAVRSFAEFRLLNKLHQKGLPVPKPVAGSFWRRGQIFYHASIIIQRIPGARPLSEFASISHLDKWHAAGVCVRRFHDAKVFHADLNCTNILVGNEIWLIDFDRGRIMADRSGDGWKASNISRLKRSLDKCLAPVLDMEQQGQLWQALLDGYHGH